jgi:hypothetical protein
MATADDSIFNPESDIANESWTLECIFGLLVVLSVRHRGQAFLLSARFLGLRSRERKEEQDDLLLDLLLDT